MQLRTGCINTKNDCMIEVGKMGYKRGYKLLPYKRNERKDMGISKSSHIETSVWVVDIAVSKISPISQTEKQANTDSCSTRKQSQRSRHFTK